MVTNFEKIKTMSEDEMAEFLAGELFEYANGVMKNMGLIPMSETVLEIAVIGKRRWLESEAAE